MRCRYFWLAIAGFAALAGFAQNLDYRTGLWEIRLNGSSPVSLEKTKAGDWVPGHVQGEDLKTQLAHPRIRHSSTTVGKACLTQENLDEKLLSVAKPDNASCKREVVNEAGKREIKITCSGAQKTSIDLHVVPSSREMLKVTGVMIITAEGLDIPFFMDGTGKWIDDSCGDVK